ncbi:hypothetical protein EGR_06359 [Echinococcus granulosus]|uniref:Uncharacterized protein n=1 Tax=Echinococcus granulosus TaxID=6210 RepID=W6UC74_ECHGR|nr:hypothetical protein EGR_06359 [Echinococcus granulosus]EUB58810.1 hypothetical protein EGR_06359 [Echinococcus granulosus]
MRRLSNTVKNHLSTENGQEIPFFPLEEPKHRRKISWRLPKFLREHGSNGYVRCRHDYEEAPSSNAIELKTKVSACAERVSWPAISTRQTRRPISEVISSSVDLHDSCQQTLNPIKLILNAMLDHKWHRVMELLSQNIPTHTTLENGTSLSLLDLFLYSCVFVQASDTTVTNDYDHIVVRILDTLLARGCSVEICTTGIQKRVLISMYHSLYSQSNIDFHAIFRRLLQSGLQSPADLLVNGEVKATPYYHLLEEYARWRLHNPHMKWPPNSLISKFLLLLNLLYSGATILPDIARTDDHAIASIIDGTHARISTLFRLNPLSLFALTRLKTIRQYPQSVHEMKQLMEWLNIVPTLPDNVRRDLMFLERRALENDLSFILLNDTNKEILSYERRQEGLEMSFPPFEDGGVTGSSQAEVLSPLTCQLAKSVTLLSTLDHVGVSLPSCIVPYLQICQYLYGPQKRLSSSRVKDTSRSLCDSRNVE